MESIISSKVTSGDGGLVASGLNNVIDVADEIHEGARVEDK